MPFFVFLLQSIFVHIVSASVGSKKSPLMPGGLNGHCYSVCVLYSVVSLPDPEGSDGFSRHFWSDYHHPGAVRLGSSESVSDAFDKLFPVFYDEHAFDRRGFYKYQAVFVHR